MLLIAQAVNSLQGVLHDGACDPRIETCSIELHISQHALTSTVDVLGASSAYVALRRTGQRARSLVSMNYLPLMSILISGIVLIGWTGFAWPTNPHAWLYLTLVGICGFLGQLCVTEELRHERSGAATNMVYLQLLWTMIFGYVIWHKTLLTDSILGSGLIFGSAVTIAVLKNAPKVVRRVIAVQEEEVFPITVSAEDGELNGGAT